MISIITINYNNKEGLRKTIESVVFQTSKDFEWIVIDGGSTDGSKEIIDEYSNYMSYYISEPDDGIYNAMNKGIMVSKGDYLLFLNSGDSLSNKDTLIEAQLYLVDKDIYVGRIHSMGKNNESVIEQDDFSPEGILRKLTFTWIPHQASFIKKRVFEKYGLYREDQKIVSDWWFYFRSLVLNNCSIASIPITVANYDTSGVSHTNHNEALVEQKNLLKEFPAISVYYHFYKENHDIIQILRGNRFLFWLYRLYYYFFRKLH
ncbi:MAG: glycosyltransferase [Prevotella sp.]|nr:glycosyltransferase [Prevotella sp.]